MFVVKDNWVSVAKIGRSIGVKGEILLHLFSDFPESITPKTTYFSQFGDLSVEYYIPKKSLVKFTQINSKEEAKQIVNLILYTTQEQSKEVCALKDNEFFWFDMIGSVIVEDGVILGVVYEIDRFCNQDYLYIKTDSALVTQNLPKNFLIPYMERYIIKVDSIQNPKIIHTKYCKEILENS